MDFGIVFFGVLFTAFSSYCAFQLRKAWLMGLASESWPRAKGRITESRFEPDEGSYNLIIKYEYAVKGKQFQGDTYTVRGYTTDLATVEEIVARYPIDSIVDVFYDPDNVGASLLEPGVDLNSYMIGAFVLSGLFLIGLSCIGYTIHSLVVGE